MVKKKTKQKITVGIVIAIVVLVALVGTLLFMKFVISKAPDPYVANDTAQTDDQPAESTTVPDDTASTTTQDPTETKLDPSEVNTIDIEPLSITVSYKKGTGPFEYEVLRTPDGTKYVEFRSQALIGTKCTDDMGPFVSIIVSPSSDESATLSKQETVEGTVYGLSLAGSTCTADTALLSKYQDSFSDAFYLLKKIN